MHRSFRTDTLLFVPPSLCTDQRQFWAGAPSDYKFVSSTQLAEAFYTTTEAGKAIVKELEAPYASQKPEQDDSAVLVEAK